MPAARAVSTNCRSSVFPAGSGFRESRGNHHHLVDSLGFELRNQIQDGGRRDGDHGQIHRHRKGVDRLVDGLPGDDAPFGIDRVDRPLESPADGIADQRMAPFAQFGRRPDECYGTWVKQSMNVTRPDR